MYFCILDKHYYILYYMQIIIFIANAAQFRTLFFGVTHSLKKNLKI